MLKHKLSTLFFPSFEVKATATFIHVVTHKLYTNAPLRSLVSISNGYLIQSAELSACLVSNGINQIILGRAKILLMFGSLCIPFKGVMI